MTVAELIAEKEKAIVEQENICLRLKEEFERIQERLLMNKGALAQMRNDLRLFQLLQSREARRADETKAA